MTRVPLSVSTRQEVLPLSEQGALPGKPRMGCSSRKERSLPQAVQTMLLASGRIEKENPLQTGQKRRVLLPQKMSQRSFR